MSDLSRRIDFLQEKQLKNHRDASGIDSLYEAAPEDIMFYLGTCISCAGSGHNEENVVVFETEIDTIEAYLDSVCKTCLGEGRVICLTIK